MNLPMQMVGLTLMSSIYRSCLMSNHYSNDLLKHLRRRMFCRCLRCPTSSKEAEKDLGQHCHAAQQNPKREAALVLWSQISCFVETEGGK